MNTLTDLLDGQLADVKLVQKSQTGLSFGVVILLVKIHEIPGCVS